MGADNGFTSDFENYLLDALSEMRGKYWGRMFTSEKRLFEPTLEYMKEYGLSASALESAFQKYVDFEADIENDQVSAYYAFDVYDELGMRAHDYCKELRASVKDLATTYVRQVDPIDIPKDLASEISNLINVDVANLDNLVHSEDVDERISAARLGRDKDLDILVHDEYLEVVCAVAKHGRPQDLDILVREEDENVRMEVAKYGRPQDLDILVHDESEWVREEVAKHDRPEDLDILVHDKHEWVRKEVAKHGRPQDLDILVRDENRQIRLEVVEHGRSQDLDILVHDEDEEVRYAAECEQNLLIEQGGYSEEVAEDILRFQSKEEYWGMVDDAGERLADVYADGSAWDEQYSATEADAAANEELAEHIYSKLELTDFDLDIPFGEIVTFDDVHGGREEYDKLFLDAASKAVAWEAEALGMPEGYEWQHRVEEVAKSWKEFMPYDEFMSKPFIVNVAAEFQLFNRSVASYVVDYGTSNEHFVDEFEHGYRVEHWLDSTCLMSPDHSKLIEWDYATKAFHSLDGGWKGDSYVDESYPIPSDEAVIWHVMSEDMRKRGLFEVESQAGAQRAKSGKKVVEESRLFIGSIDPKDIKQAKYSLRVGVPFDLGNKNMADVYVQASEVMDDKLHSGKKMIALNPEHDYTFDVTVDVDSKSALEDAIKEDFGPRANPELVRVRASLSAEEFKRHVDAGRANQRSYSREQMEAKAMANVKSDKENVVEEELS